MKAAKRPANCMDQYCTLSQNGYGAPEGCLRLAPCPLHVWPRQAHSTQPMAAAYKHLGPGQVIETCLKKRLALLASFLPSQRSLHNAPIFRLLLKVAVNGTHQCDCLNFCGSFGSQQDVAQGGGCITKYAVASWVAPRRACALLGVRAICLPMSPGLVCW